MLLKSQVHSFNIFLGEFEEETLGRQIIMRIEPNPYKKMTPPSTQNL